MPKTFRSSLCYGLKEQCGALVKVVEGENKVYTRNIEVSRDWDADSENTLELAHIAKVGGKGTDN